MPVTNYNSSSIQRHAISHAAGITIAGGQWWIPFTTPHGAPLRPETRSGMPKDSASFLCGMIFYPRHTYSNADFQRFRLATSSGFFPDELLLASNLVLIMLIQKKNNGAQLYLWGDANQVG